MALTPATLPRHELIGLWVRIAVARNPALEGIEGRIVRETENTLVVAGTDGRQRRAPKQNATFEFALAERDATSHGGPRSHDIAGAVSGYDHGREPTTAVVRPTNPIYVTVDGERLVGSPARRTETRGESKWR